MIQAGSFFVTGTDTGVGKTFFSCALLHHLRQQGSLAVGYKPVASGAYINAQGERCNEDALALQEASSAGFTLRQINPVCLMQATAPHIAAMQEGIGIDFAALVTAYQQLASHANSVVVEGAGGLLVPLDAKRDFADLAHALALPLILVVGVRLGCINHSLLTAEAISRRKLRFAGWVANLIDPAFEQADATIDTLRARLTAPLIARLPCLASPLEAAPLLNLPSGPYASEC